MEARSKTLTFHGIGAPPRELEPSEAEYWVSQDRFLAVLDSVADRDDDVVAKVVLGVAGDDDAVPAAVRTFVAHGFEG